MGLKMKVKAVVALAVALSLLPGVSHALTLKQKALVGLKGVGVDVAKISPEAERLGLTAAQVKTDVELRLRKARVRVLTVRCIRRARSPIAWGPNPCNASST